MQTTGNTTKTNWAGFVAAFIVVTLIYWVVSPEAAAKVVVALLSLGMIIKFANGPNSRTY